MFLNVFFALNNSDIFWREFVLRDDSKCLVPAWINIVEENDRLIFKFIAKKKQKLVPYYFVVSSFAPPFPGCIYCKYKKILNDVFFYCDFKQKTFSKNLKSCRFFKQREEE